MDVDLTKSLSGRSPSLLQVSRCGMVVRGVPVEWVEVTVATPGQPTFIYFAGGELGGPVDGALSSLADLAAATGARIFRVGTRPTPGDRFLSAVEDGVTAYSWLLEEGLDLGRTSFIGDDVGGRLSLAMLSTARKLGLALPTGPRFWFPARL